MSEVGDGADDESLVPHTHAVLGLKVADAEEEETVRRLAAAVLGLIVLLLVHFVVHIAQHGHVAHAVGHLLTAAVLPAVGYVAISQRSTKAAWAFHLMTVISSVIHVVMLMVVLLHVVALQSEGDTCSKFAQPCKEHVLRTPPMAYTPRQDFWRCSGNWCIEASRHCDGEVNCFDRSDELGCIDASAMSGGHGSVPTATPALPDKDMERCLLLVRAQAKAPRLQWWWLLMSLPLWGLCIFAAYYSLEFYVQLRVRRLSARVDRATADATVFDRAEVAE